jgi:hypothetical protein
MSFFNDYWDAHRGDRRARVLPQDVGIELSWKDKLVRTELGMPIPWSAVIGRGHECVVLAQSVIAYRSAVRVDLVVIAGSGARSYAPIGFLPYALVADLGQGDLSRLPASFLRFACIADGAIATNIHIGLSVGRAEGDLLSDGGHGTNDIARTTYWMTLLPSRTGNFQLVVEWPAVGIAETRTTIESSLIVEASEQSVAIWDSPSSPDFSRGLGA